MEKNNVTHQYKLRGRSTLKQPEVFGGRNEDPGEEKPLMRRIISSFRNKSKNRDKAEQSDQQIKGKSSPKSKGPNKKNKGNRKRKLNDSEIEPNELAEQNKNVENKKKSKKRKDDKSYRDLTPTNTKVNKEEEKGDPDEESEGKKYLNDISAEVEQVKNNINNLTIAPEHVETISENEPSPLITEYEEKCMKKITEIFEKSKEFENKIETFSDVEDSQAFYYIDETLQRNIEKLDRIDIMDYKVLKEERKNVIKYIYRVIEKLETKARENASTQSNKVNVVENSV